MNPDTALEFPITVMITVKAYPQPSKKSGESVCLAGVQLESGPARFVRLYPIDFRGLPHSMQFHKYEVIRCMVRRPTSDTRPESYCPIEGTLERVDEVPEWDDRARLLEPLRVGSMCELYELNKLHGTSLGLFRPQSIDDFEIEPGDPWDDGRLATVNQGSLLELDHPRRPLEQIPYRFLFTYHCYEAGCNGHRMSTVDWEAGELYRRLRGRPHDERLRLVRERWLYHVCGPRRDAQFFVGNLKKRPTQFLVLGVFWPPRMAAVRQLELALA